jgi:uncharacterized protein YjbJ (UPF0337 family)
MTANEIDTDKTVGRAKEAAGALAGDKHLKNEGRIDQAKSTAKHAVDTVADTVTGVADALTGHNRDKK